MAYYDFKGKNIIQDYGNTHSYVTAIENIYKQCQAHVKKTANLFGKITLSETTKTSVKMIFADWISYSEIATEYFKLGEIDKKCLYTIKEDAVQSLCGDLAAACSLIEVLNSFNVVKQLQCILRLHRKNV